MSWLSSSQRTAGLLRPSSGDKNMTASIGSARISLAALLVLAASAALAQTPQAAAATAAFASSTLKIGVIGPFTGSTADFGVTMLNGIQQAVDEINGVGGYLGHKLEIVRKDDQSDPDTGLKMSQELVAEKVAATIGFCNTGVARAIASKSAS
jgi:branched-chain amino acid transport system substrate-binding protein